MTDAAACRGIVAGAGAHGGVVAAVWARMEPGRALCFVDDDPARRGATVGKWPVIGDVEAAREALAAGAPIIVGIGHNRVRLAVAERMPAGTRFAVVVDPSAVVMPGARLGGGTFVGPQAVVHCAAVLGAHVVVQAGAVIEHHGVAEDGAFIGPGARMSGRISIGRGAFIAAGATLVNRARIGEGAIVGAGSVVTGDIPPGALAYGVPARVVRQATDRDWQRLL